MAEHKKYTLAEIEKAKETDMINFLESKGYSFKTSGKAYKCVEHDSLVINKDRHRWYWNSRSIGGYSAIDFCTKIEGMRFPEALSNILGNQQTYIPKSPLHESKTTVADIVLPKAEKGKYKRLFGYLCMKRKIDPQLIIELIRRKQLYQDNKGNVVFLGYEKGNKKPQYGSIRGTGDKQFRGDVQNSRKEVGFFIGNHNAETLHIFEAPIDAMSFATFLIGLQTNQTVTGVFENYALLSLGGTSDVALEHYLNNHENVKKIVVCLDNDEAGRTAGKKISQKYKDKYVITRLSYSGKDLNDSLISASKDLNEYAQKRSSVNIK